MKRLLVTGGAGFIGSNFIRHLIAKYDSCRIVNLDKLTYAGNRDNLRDIAKNKRYRFIKGDICDAKTVETAVRGVDAVINFAAETHVDRSINNPGDFAKTNFYGTYMLLEAVKKHKIKRYIHISTDEVYGSAKLRSFNESAPLNPTNPYSASKAGSDLLAMSYYRTYGLPVIITRSSNNYGPCQHPEKVIPLFVTNAIEGKMLPLYGKGANVRDWLFVEDNCKAIDLILRAGKNGSIYNIGGGTEINNRALAGMILYALRKPEKLIRYVADRPAHDLRYSLDCRKIRKELGWKPETSFEKGLEITIGWYKDNSAWWKRIKNGEFKNFYNKQYSPKKVITP